MASFPGRTSHWQNYSFLTLLALKKKKQKKKTTKKNPKMHGLVQSSPLASCLYMEELSKFGCSSGYIHGFLHIDEEL